MKNIQCRPFTYTSMAEPDSKSAYKYSVGKYSANDMEQFNQLIGYSISGYNDLPFIRQSTKDKAFNKKANIR